MALKQPRLELLDGSSHREGLLQYIDAVLVVLDHAANARQVPLDVAKPFEGVDLGLGQTTNASDSRQAECRVNAGCRSIDLTMRGKRDV